MSKLKIYEKPAGPIGKNAMYCWWFANLFNVINQARKITRINAQAKYYKRLIREAPEKKNLFDDKFAQLKVAKAKAIRGIFKSGADFMTASKGSGIAGKLGITFNDGHIGCFGIISSLIACYELYPK
jgi:hypothetical protein